MLLTCIVVVEGGIADDDRPIVSIQVHRSSYGSVVGQKHHTGEVHFAGCYYRYGASVSFCGISGKFYEFAGETYAASDGVYRTCRAPEREQARSEDQDPVLANGEANTAVS